MKIYTYQEQHYSETFERLKRKASGPWSFLIAGEWSQTPFHQGNHSFYIRSSADGRFWALLSRGFPNRIIAVADTAEPIQAETAAAAMMRAVAKGGGDYIDTVHDFGKFGQKVWELYRAK